MQEPRLPGDVYEYLGRFAEDKDVLNMLSVNKKFNDPIFFERVLRNRYPFLLEFKDNETSWRSFYVSMIFYISKIKEALTNEDNISFDPHKIDSNSNKLWEIAFSAALASNNQ